MILTNDELIEEFYNKNLSEFPYLTLENFKDICYSPWRFLKSEMESERLPKVRLMHFGIFQVYKGRAENMLYNLKERFKFNKINPKQYFSLKKMLENYLNNLDEKRKSNN